MTLVKITNVVLDKNYGLLCIVTAGLGTDVLEAEKPRRIQSLVGVVDIACGGLHSLALTEDGKVMIYFW